MSTRASLQLEVHSIRRSTAAPRQADGRSRDAFRVRGPGQVVGGAITPDAEIRAVLEPKSSDDTVRTSEMP